MIQGKMDSENILDYAQIKHFKEALFLEPTFKRGTRLHQL